MTFQQQICVINLEDIYPAIIIFTAVDVHSSGYVNVTVALRTSGVAAHY